MEAKMSSTHVDPTRAEWVSGVLFYGPGAVHEGRDIVQMKVLSDRRGEGGGIAWLVRYSVHGHVGRPEYPHAVVASRIPSLVPPRAPDPGDLSRGAIHRLASEMCLINKEETVYA
jgi:hypothetical protein